MSVAARSDSCSRSGSGGGGGSSDGAGSACPPLPQVRNSVDSYPSSSDPSDILDRPGSDDDCYDKFSDKEDVPHSASYQQDFYTSVAKAELSQSPGREQTLVDKLGDGRMDFCRTERRPSPPRSYYNKLDFSFRENFNRSSLAFLEYSRSGSRPDNIKETPSKDFPDNMNVLDVPRHMVGGLYHNSRPSQPIPEESLDLSARRSVSFSSGKDAKDDVSKENDGQNDSMSASLDRPSFFPVNGDRQSISFSRERTLSSASSGRDLNSSFSGDRRVVSPYFDSSSSSLSASCSPPPPVDAAKNRSETSWAKGELGERTNARDSSGSLHEDGEVAQWPSPLNAAQLSKVPISMPSPSFLEHLAMFSNTMFPRAMGGPSPRLPYAPPPLPASGPAVAFQGQVYSCHLCDFTGSSKDDFDNHMRVHYTYECPQCDYISRTPGRLQKHIKDSHSDPDQQRVAAARPKVHRCKQCDFSTTDKNASYEHRRIHIKPEKLLECKHCRFVTEHKHHLEYHLRNHFNSKPYKCSKCNYSCVNKSMLNSHMKSHTKACQFRCADCSFASKYSHGMKMHLCKTNHQLGAILNSDGSYPQTDVSASRLSSKGGPDRSAQKDMSFRDGLVPGFFPVGPAPRVPHPMVPFNNMMSPGMFPYPVWPFMPNCNNVQAPPPPLIRAVDRPGQGMSSAQEKMDRCHPHQATSHPEQERSRKDTLDKREFMCTRCSFCSDTWEELQAHGCQVHNGASHEPPKFPPTVNTSLHTTDHRMDNQAPKSDSQQGQLLESTGCQTLQEDAASMINMKKRFAMADEYNRYHAESGNAPQIPSRSSPEREMPVEKSLVSDDMYRPNADTTSFQPDRPYRPYNGQSGFDILQQMTQKFGSDSALDPQSVHSETSMSKTGRSENQTSLREEQDSLDLRNKLLSPSYEDSHVSSHQNLPENFVGGKRKLSETDIVNGKESALGGEDTPAQPRKRSRKGKAFKRDMLYLMRHEDQQRSENMSDNFDNDRPEMRGTLPEEDSVSRDGNSPPERKTEVDPAGHTEEYVDQNNHSGQCQAASHMSGDLTSVPGCHQSSKTDSAGEGESVDEAKTLKQKESAPSSQSLADSQKENTSSSQNPTDSSSQEKEEDPLKEREELIQLLCKSRHQQLPPSKRRSTEVAWKILMDPSLGLQLPPEIVSGGPEETQPSDGVLSTTSSSSSPPPLNPVRRNSISTFPSPEKTNNVKLPGPPITVSTRSKDDQEHGTFYRPRASSAAASIALARKENAVGTFPYGLAASAKGNLPALPYPQRPSSTKENAAFFHCSHHMLSSSAQTVASRHSGFPALGVTARGHPVMQSWRPFECQFCDMSFKDSMQYNIHMSFHQTHNPFECRRCGSAYNNKVDFYRHLLMVKHD